MWGQSLASPKGRSSIIAAAACLCNRDWLCVATSGVVYCYLCICVLFLCIAFVYCICVLFFVYLCIAFVYLCICVLFLCICVLYLCNRGLVITAKALLRFQSGPLPYCHCSHCRLYRRQCTIQTSGECYTREQLSTFPPLRKL